MVGESLDLNAAVSTDCFEVRTAQRCGEVQYGRFFLLSLDATPSLEVCVGYRRCCDFDPKDQPGQDFAMMRGDGHNLVAVVADGVGQSFFGDVAARQVGTWLVEELWRSRVNAPSDEELQIGLRKQEQALSELVRDQPLDHLPPWLRSSLEQTRERHGSQAVFAAFLWHRKRNQVQIYQVGDARVLAHYPSGETVSIEANPRGRYSSTGKTKLLLKKSIVEGAEGIVLKSDGASTDWGVTGDRDSIDRDRFYAMAREKAEADDVSFISVFSCQVQDVRQHYPYPIILQAPAPVGPSYERESRLDHVAAVEPPPMPVMRRTWHETLRTKLGTFAAGLVVGVLLTSGALSILMKTGRLARPVHEQQHAVTQGTPYLPARHGQHETVVSETKIVSPDVLLGASALFPANQPNIRLDLREEDPKVFLNRHRRYLPKMVSDFLRKHPHGVVVRVSISGVLVSRVELSVSTEAPFSPIIVSLKAGEAPKFFTLDFPAGEKELRSNLSLYTNGQLPIVQKKWSFRRGRDYEISVGTQ